MVNSSYFVSFRADLLSVFDTNARTWISRRRSRRLSPRHKTRSVSVERGSRSIWRQWIHFEKPDFLQTEPFYGNATMHCIQICTDITAKRNSPKPNTIGGGRRIECLINWTSHDITQVRLYLMQKKVCDLKVQNICVLWILQDWCCSSKKTTTWPRIFCICWHWCRNAPPNYVPNATFCHWAHTWKRSTTTPTPTSIRYVPSNHTWFRSKTRPRKEIPTSKKRTKSNFHRSLTPQIESILINGMHGLRSHFFCKQFNANSNRLSTISNLKCAPNERCALLCSEKG